MILVNNFGATDYAIMKQIQQIRLINPNDHTLSVAELGNQPDLSRVGLNEALYVVSHGYRGDLLGSVDRDGLLAYLNHAQHGIPQNFNGNIILLSCFSGTAPSGGESLAKYVADRLRGRAAQNTVVTGATGYSYGTPEFRRTQRSSVLRDGDFYRFGDIDGMAAKWLTLHPTHAAGVLHRDFNLVVDINNTIQNQLARVQGQGTPLEIATRYMTGYARDAGRIENTLTDRLTRTPGATIALRADYLVTQNAVQIVIDWNDAIREQDDLFTGLYLWTPTANAFTTANVP